MTASFQYRPLMSAQMGGANYATGLTAAVASKRNEGGDSLAQVAATGLQADAARDTEWMRGISEGNKAAQAGAAALLAAGLTNSAQIGRLGMEIEADARSQKSEQDFMERNSKGGAAAAIGGLGSVAQLLFNKGGNVKPPALVKPNLFGGKGGSGSVNAWDPDLRLSNEQGTGVDGSRFAGAFAGGMPGSGVDPWDPGNKWDFFKK